jgi:hypothetical protein
MSRRLLQQAQVLKAHEEVLTQAQTWIYHKSLKPHKEVLERGLKGFRMSVVVGGTNTLQRSEGKAFILSPKN